MWLIICSDNSYAWLICTNFPRQFWHESPRLHCILLFSSMHIFMLWSFYCRKSLTIFLYSWKQFKERLTAWSKMKCNMYPHFKLKIKSLTSMPLKSHKKGSRIIPLVGLSKERPYLVLALNFILSQISSFTHIYGFADFNGFVDLWISADFQI